MLTLSLILVRSSYSRTFQTITSLNLIFYIFKGGQISILVIDCLYFIHSYFLDMQVKKKKKKPGLTFASQMFSF